MGCSFNRKGLMKKKLIVIGYTTDYSMLDINALRDEYTVYHVKLPDSLRSILLRVKNISPKVFNKLLFIYYRLKLKGINADYLICDDNLISLNLLIIFDENEKFKNIAVVLRNIIKDTSVLKLLSERNFDIFSFDYDNCLKFGLKFYNQYCSGYDFLINNVYKEKVEYDFYFLGLDKGRRNILDGLSTKIGSYRCLIDIKQRPNVLHKVLRLHKKNKTYEYVSYNEHLKRILRSRIIIDIVQQGQSGLTMRALEAQVAKKKLITNNIYIKSEEFYNPDNIMVINDGDEINNNDLEVFLSSPFVEIDDHVIASYSPRSVYKRMLNDEF